jgi:hypothetical protein
MKWKQVSDWLIIGVPNSSRQKSGIVNIEQFRVHGNSEDSERTLGIYFEGMHGDEPK